MDSIYFLIQIQANSDGFVVVVKCSYKSGEADEWEVSVTGRILRDTQVPLLDEYSEKEALWDFADAWLEIRKISFTWIALVVCSHRFNLMLN